MQTMEELRNRIKRLKSDRADLDNPKILKKYPHLDSDDLRTDLDTQINKAVLDLDRKEILT